ncbi:MULTISPECIES: hypothetical protein [Brasilonema]|uniref:hypothetical protein n=1 Tax=Brasilonema TaxID=383614 RepID=UPI00145D2212|nr:MULTISPECIES: hypothetical protein [Brasilonema]
MDKMIRVAIALPGWRGLRDGWGSAISLAMMRSARSYRPKKSALLHQVADLQSVKVNEVGLLLKCIIPGLEVMDLISYQNMRQTHLVYG